MAKDTPRIGRPPKPAGERKVTLTVRVRPDVKARVYEMAKAIGAPVSTVVEILVDRVPKKEAE